MSRAASTEDPDPIDAYRDRILKLEAIEEELELLADTNLPIADRCRNWLTALDEVRRNE